MNHIALFGTIYGSHGSILFNFYLYLLELCKRTPEPTFPTSTDLPAPHLQPTDEADANDRNTKGHSTPMRCNRQSCNLSPMRHRTKPIYANCFLVFQPLDTASFY